MPIPKIQPASFKPVLISKHELSGYTWTLQQSYLIAITVISFFCVERPTVIRGDRFKYGRFQVRKLTGMELVQMSTQWIYAVMVW